MTIATFARQSFYVKIHWELALTLCLGTRWAWLSTLIATWYWIGCIGFHKSKVFQYSVESFKMNPIQMELSIQNFSQSLQVDVFQLNYLIQPNPIGFLPPSLTNILHAFSQTPRFFLHMILSFYFSIGFNFDFFSFLWDSLNDFDVGSHSYSWVCVWLLLCSFSFGKSAIALSLCNYCDDFFTYSSLGIFFKE